MLQIGDTMCFRQSDITPIDSPIPVSPLLEKVMRQNANNRHLPIKWQYVGLANETFAKYPAALDKHGCNFCQPTTR